MTGADAGTTVKKIFDVGGTKTELDTREVKVPKDAEIYISAGAFTDASKTVIVDGVAVTLTDSTNSDTISFTMPGTDYRVWVKDVSNGTLRDSKDTDVTTAMYPIHVGAGLTVAQKASDVADHKVEKVSDSLFYAVEDAVLTVTGGKYGSFASDTAKTTDTVAAADADFTVGTSEVYLKPYAAVTITANSGDATAQIFSAATGGSAEANLNVAKDATIYVAPVAGKGTGVLVGTAKAGTALVPASAGARVAYQVTDDVTLTGAYKVTLNDGITAVVTGTSTAVTSGQYVANDGSATLDLTVADTDNTVAVDTAGGKKIGVAVTTTAVFSADQTYSAYTKMVLPAGAGMTVAIANILHQSTGETASSGAAAVTIGVAPNTEVIITGVQATGLAIKLNGNNAEGEYADDDISILAKTNTSAGTSPSMIAVIGEKAVTVTQEAV